ncbi:phosphodiester glycosidase family protein [Ectobacillus ponti]|uniref:Phosphodiester glycosidase family protein n=1 Tax=Ectobacillus ponti TaxID=2961894 RepID=A0AA41X7N0_9BACI|nr:phosphodiester glycosidase family protein [Ectobacillus ponti]MCP8968375.1 phosphodiester glycosidase family protein [Ectobacillus ponti]
MTTAVATSREMLRKPKKRKLLRQLLILVFVLFLGGGGFLYGTNQGHEIRRMLVGTALSTMHYQWVLQFLPVLLPQAEIDELNKLRTDPPTEQTTIAKPAAAAARQAKAVRVETVETSNYTAKVLIVPDPTTVHLVVTALKEKGEPLSDLIKNNHGVAGINAGGFIDQSGKGMGGQPIGVVISRGAVLNVPNGDRSEKQLVAAFLPNGEFITGSYSTNQLVNLGAKEAVSFGPQLIVNGASKVTHSLDNAWGWAPRTAIGQAEDGSMIMVATDGRFYADKSHRGASMSDLVKIFESYHVTNAIAMDGGGSTTMIKDGELQLKPATSTAVGMRYLPNAWVVIPH